MFMSIGIHYVYIINMGPRTLGPGPPSQPKMKKIAGLVV